MERDVPARGDTGEPPRPRRRGGRQPGAGRPRIVHDAVRCTVLVPASDVEELRTLGVGNVSAGLRRLLAEARERREQEEHAASA